MPTNNERKNIIKLIRSLENRGALFNTITRKIISQAERLLNCLRPLMKVDLRLMKKVLTSQMQEMKLF